MAGFNSQSDDHAPLAEINITPLVDVMLVLLVIFMVTAPLLENGMGVQLPKANTGTLHKQNDAINLSLTKEGRVFLNKVELSPSDLRTRLIAMTQGKTNREVMLRADGTLPYSVVAQTISLVRQAGISKIGLVTLPEGKK